MFVAQLITIYGLAMVWLLQLPDLACVPHCTSSATTMSSNMQQNIRYVDNMPVHVDKASGKPHITIPLDGELLARSTGPN